MRIIHLFLACLLFTGLPLASVAANEGATSVRAISFSASHERGPTDPKLAPYESILRSNLRFESFKYVGESSASVSPGGTASLSLPSGGRVELEGDKGGNVKVRRGGNVVTVSPGRPSVFIDGTAGVIVMVH